MSSINKCARVHCIKCIWRHKYYVLLSKLFCVNNFLINDERHFKLFGGYSGKWPRQHISRSQDYWGSIIMHFYQINFICKSYNTHTHIHVYICLYMCHIRVIMYENCLKSSRSNTELTPEVWNCYNFWLVWSCRRIRQNFRQMRSLASSFCKTNFWFKSKGRCLLAQLYSIITALLSIIEKNGSGLFDSIFNQE